MAICKFRNIEGKKLLVLDTNEIMDYRKSDYEDIISIMFKNKEKLNLLFSNKILRDRNFNELTSLMKKDKKKGILSMESIKEYFRKHQELIINLAFLLLLDEYVFEGKFRERIRNIVENLFTKTEKKILKEDK